MFIHKSFSVSELIDIVEIFEMDIPDYKDFYKKGLIFYMELYIQNHRPINFYNQYFNFNNHFDLVNYLNQPNNKLKLSIQKKKEINDNAKKILKYCKEYKNDNFSEIFNLASSISSYGLTPPRLLDDAGDTTTTRQSVIYVPLQLININLVYIPVLLARH
jgi:hypothetical protein